MKKIKHNKNSISFSFFRSISMTSILFMVLLFLGISGLFLKHSFRLEGRNALQQLSYISGQFQYYLDATENYSKTILSDDTVQEYMKDYLAAKYSSNATTNVKQHIRQIIQSTPFIHSVSLYSDQGLLLVSTEPDSSQMNLSDPALSPVWQVGMKRHLNDRHKEVKVLSYIRPFYNINSGRMLGYVELSIPETQISGIYKQYNTTNELFLIDKNGQVQSSNGNPELDSLINFKLAEARRAGAQVRAEFRLPAGLSLPLFTVNTILGNLLDNAVEGLARCPQKELSLALWADRGLCRLRVENTFDGTLLQDHEGNFKTRKAETSLHGMGLDSVRRALSSLDGFLQVRIEGRRFIAEAIWYLPEHPQTTDITS